MKYRNKETFTWNEEEYLYFIICSSSAHIKKKL